jgi:hypothetical protein
VNQKTKIFAETGSALDATEISRIKVACPAGALLATYTHNNLLMCLLDSCWQP